MKDRPSFTTFTQSDTINGAIKKHSLPTTINISFSSAADSTGDHEKDHEETALLSTQNTKS